MTTLDTIGGRLRHAREQAGFSRRTLADRSKVSERTIEHYEKGTAEASVEKLRVLGEALNISLPWLVSGDESEAAPVDGMELPENPADLIEDQEEEDIGEAEQIELLLEEIDRMRAEGFSNYQRRLAAVVDDIRDLFRYLEPAELVSLGERRGLAVVEAHSAKQIAALFARKVVAEDILGFDDNDDQRVMAEAICKELVERVLDTALIGSDLYAVKLDQLAAFADKNDISPGRFLFFGWRGQAEIVPSVREKYRQDAKKGAVSFAASKRRGNS
ncbi:helix-turn-helix domain-containing protein [Govanella unica]|uniref:Helix-turn-helix domain-containing protein n=1 Tax=Govanella unica TaxID=2975056 RepID=A0A9X3TVL9_9PROT|nr:helix-turn-helix domain-containing protein [Govania unica]